MTSMNQIHFDGYLSYIFSCKRVCLYNSKGSWLCWSSRWIFLWASQQWKSNNSTSNIGDSTPKRTDNTLLLVKDRSRSKISIIKVLWHTHCDKRVRWLTASRADLHDVASPGSFTAHIFAAGFRGSPSWPRRVAVYYAQHFISLKIDQQAISEFCEEGKTKTSSRNLLTSNSHTSF